jgi:hypothetical protein
MNLPESLQQNDEVSELLPEAVMLLENDFRTAGIDAVLAGRIFGDIFDLRDEIATLVKKTGGLGAESFYHLLYRADIPESQTRKALSAPSALSFEETIAELLIIRALQRAYYRKKFGSR